jgi:hypothetical protein
MEPPAKLDFGDPVVGMELRYLEYNMMAEESTLLEMLAPYYPAVASPRRTSSAPVHLLRGEPENEGGTGGSTAAARGGSRRRTEPEGAGEEPC